MPTLPPTSLLNIINYENTTATNATGNPLQVICAWPVSGQYGPGTRVLYYALIVACIFARKIEWIRTAYLAAALLFPTVAAIHGIVLAALHNSNAVDMDIYGAFQICSIGVLAAPVTVRNSKTYFYDPGRNIIFLWTGIILAGLLSLTVEFFRSQGSACTHDDFGDPIFPNENDFFNYNTSCGLVCSVNSGPFSPLRGGSANNIYVIPVPDKLTFGTATLLAAACCIPAILSLVSMWDKILEINWKTRFGDRNRRDSIDAPIEGTNGATIESMKSVNKLIRSFLSAVEIPTFGAIVLLIIIFGERNLFSAQVKYQTEPIASIGQWAPLVGTGLGVVGSFYLLLASPLEDKKLETSSDSSVNHSNNSMQQVNTAPSPPQSVINLDITETRRSYSDDDRGSSRNVAHTTTQQSQRSLDVGGRHKVAKALSAVGDYFSTAAPDRFDDSDFKHGKAVDFPEIPGEEQRNRSLRQIREQYNHGRDSDTNMTPVLNRSRSRATSFNGSVASGLGIEGAWAISSTTSPEFSTSAQPPADDRNSADPQNPPPQPSTGSIGLIQRRDTLEVPLPIHSSPTRNNSHSISIPTFVNMPASESSPAIVVSSDIDAPSPVHALPPNSPASPPSSNPLPPIPPTPIPSP